MGTNTSSQPPPIDLISLRTSLQNCEPLARFIIPVGVRRATAKATLYHLCFHADPPPSHIQLSEEQCTQIDQFRRVTELLATHLERVDSPHQPSDVMVPPSVWGKALRKKWFELTESVLIHLATTRVARFDEEHVLSTTPSWTLWEAIWEEQPPTGCWCIPTATMDLLGFPIPETSQFPEELVHFETTDLVCVSWEDWRHAKAPLKQSKASQTTPYAVNFHVDNTCDFYTHMVPGGNFCRVSYSLQQLSQLQLVPAEAKMFLPRELANMTEVKTTPADLTRLVRYVTLPVVSLCSFWGISEFRDANARVIATNILANDWSKVETIYPSRVLLNFLDVVSLVKGVYSVDSEEVMTHGWVQITHEDYIRVWRQWVKYVERESV